MIPNLKICAHIHFSGRPCGRRLYTAGGFCGLHRLGNPLDGTTLCSECDAMLEVFPFRRTVRIEPVI